MVSKALGGKRRGQEECEERCVAKRMAAEGPESRGRDEPTRPQPSLSPYPPIPLHVPRQEVVRQKSSESAEE